MSEASTGMRYAAIDGIDDDTVEYTPARPLNLDAGEFDRGARVRALTQVKNDGTYPHKGIGSLLVRKGDLGHVHEKWRFVGQTYYTVEFIERAVVVVMRGKEMVHAVASARA